MYIWQAGELIMSTTKRHRVDCTTKRRLFYFSEKRRQFDENFGKIELRWNLIYFNDEETARAAFTESRNTAFLI